MTNADLTAARQRLEQRQRDLDDARTGLARVEHQAYSDALQLIADEVHDAVDAPTRDNDAGGWDALGNIGLVLEGIGVSPSPKPQPPAAVRR